MPLKYIRSSLLSNFDKLDIKNVEKVMITETNEVAIMLINTSSDNTREVLVLDIAKVINATTPSK